MHIPIIISCQREDQGDILMDSLPSEKGMTLCEKE